ncbi:MAG: hypothetical protein HQK96_11485 [Nitrospirae bacterium]|nr:hypothetical protein [Nitrospirota bacterium]
MFRAGIIKILVPIYIITIFGLPLCIVVMPFLLTNSIGLRMALLVIAPISYVITFIITAGLLSLPHQSAIIKGRFPRNLDHPIYGRRYLYGLCWTAVYYFKPLYYIALTVPILKKMLFRIFGYKGNINFTIYPDTWVRDLPLLNFGEGSYLSNRATIGTNMVLNNGFILVDGVTVEKKGLIGHLSMLGPGVYIGEHAEVGVGVAVGINVRLGNNSKVSPYCAINHGANIYDNSEVGTHSYIGGKTIIKENIVIPAASSIPSRVVINAQNDVLKYISLITNDLNKLKEEMSKMIDENV